MLDEATGMSMVSVISDGVDSDDRHRHAGYAQALSDVMGTLNRYLEGLVTRSFQLFSRLAAVFAEEVGDRDIISLALQFAKTFDEGGRFG